MRGLYPGVATLTRATISPLTPRRDRQKIRRLQARAADQRAVDVGDRHQFGRIRWFDGAAIEDADLRALGLETARELIADEAMHLLDILRLRRQPRADRPDRLIGDHEIRGRGAIRQRALELGAADIQRLAGIAL